MELLAHQSFNSVVSSVATRRQVPDTKNVLQTGRGLQLPHMGVEEIIYMKGGEAGGVAEI